MVLEVGEKRERRWLAGVGVGGGQGTDTSLITSFLSIFSFILHESPLSKQQ